MLVALVVVILGAGGPKILNGMELVPYTLDSYMLVLMLRLANWLATICTGFCSAMFWYLYEENTLLKLGKKNCIERLC